MEDDVDTIEPAASAPSEQTTITIPNSSFAALTYREMQVAQRLCAGQRNSQIAEELGISVKTVDTHRGHVLKKAGVPNNTCLLILALCEGFVVLDDVRHAVVACAPAPAVAA